MQIVNDIYEAKELSSKLNEAAPQPVLPQDIDKLQSRLAAGKFRVYKTQPFLGHILQRLGTVITNDIPTMAVDDKGNIYLNPDFSLNKLTFDEFIGVLVHETMHIATLTFDRRKGRDHQLWNIATDYIMNRDILKSGLSLPSMGCLPEKRGEEWFVKFTGKNGPFEVNVTDITAEHLFTQMAKNAIVQQRPGGGPGGPGKSGKGSGDGTPSPLDKVIETGSGKGDKGDKEGEGTPKPVDGTSGPINKTKPQIINDVITASENAKADQEEAEKSRGVGAGGLRNHVMSHHQPQVNWRQILKNIVAKTVTEYNWKRPNKRAMAAGYYAPKVQNYDSLAPITVAIDTSGSITQKELNVFVTELLGIFKIYRQAKITIVLWHSNAYYHVDINNQNCNSLMSNLLTHLQSGGTTMSSVVDYLKAHKLDKTAAVIYLTDGYVEGDPTVLPQPCKNYCMVTDNNGLAGLKKVKNLVCYKININ